MNVTVREPLGDVEYWYRRGGRRVFKTVHFFLCDYVSGSTADHDHEVDEARWIPLREARSGAHLRGRAGADRARALQAGVSALAARLTGPIHRCDGGPGPRWVLVSPEVAWFLESRCDGPRSSSGASPSPRRPADARREQLNPAELLLSLQRGAGNRAVAQMVQRAIGFEYEVNRETYKAPGRLSAGERQGYPAIAPGQRRPDRSARATRSWTGSAAASAPRPTSAATGTTRTSSSRSIPSTRRPRAGPSSLSRSSSSSCSRSSSTARSSAATRRCPRTTWPPRPAAPAVSTTPTSSPPRRPLAGTRRPRPGSGWTRSRS